MERVRTLGLLLGDLKKYYYYDGASLISIKIVIFGDFIDWSYYPGIVSARDSQD